jgi:hypothetical protein
MLIIQDYIDIQEVRNMPKKDGTGPKGNGPMTGQGSGYCIVPLNTPKEELSYLKNQERVLREQRLQVKTRLRVLDTTVGSSER